MQHLIQKAQQFAQNNPKGVIIIRGATATGKTALSLEIARSHQAHETIHIHHHIPGKPNDHDSERSNEGGSSSSSLHPPSNMHKNSLILPQSNFEIISADSRQIYREMNIATDKIPEKIRKEIPHHLIDIVNPDEVYTAGQWKQDTQQAIHDIHARGNIPMIVGGTGLYIDMIYKNFAMPEVAPNMEWRAMMMEKEAQETGFLFRQLQAIDPLEAQKHHENSLRYVLRALEIYHSTGKTKTELAQELPVKWPLLMIGLRRDREETNKRINARIKEMFRIGLLEEVQTLLQKYGPEASGMQAIGYKEIVGYLQGHYDRDKAEEYLKRNSHHLAKKQRTWFRRYIAEGKVQPKDNVEYVVEML